MNRLTISEAANIISVHPETLRRYEEKGYISSVRTEGGHRRYTKADVEALVQRIKAEKISSTPEVAPEKQLGFQDKWLQKQIEAADKIQLTESADPREPKKHKSFKDFLEYHSDAIAMGVVLFYLLLIFGSLTIAMFYDSKAGVLLLSMAITTWVFLNKSPLLSYYLTGFFISLIQPVIATVYLGVSLEASVGTGIVYLILIGLGFLTAEIYSFLDHYRR